MQSGSVDGEFVIQPDPCSGTNLPDAETVPFANRFIGVDDRIFSGGASCVVPETSRSLVGPQPPVARFFCGIPNLNLRSCFQIDSRISFWQQFEINEQLEVLVLFGGRHVDALAVVDQFSVVDRPVLDRVFPLLIEKRLTFLFGHLVQFVRVLSMSDPAVEIFPVEQGCKTLRRDVLS